MSTANNEWHTEVKWCLFVGGTSWFQARPYSWTITQWWKPFWWCGGLRWSKQHAATLQLRQRNWWSCTTTWSITLLYCVQWCDATNTITSLIIIRVLAALGIYFLSWTTTWDYCCCYPAIADACLPQDDICSYKIWKVVAFFCYSCQVLHSTFETFVQEQVILFDVGKHGGDIARFGQTPFVRILILVHGPDPILDRFSAAHFPWLCVSTIP